MIRAVEIIKELLEIKESRPLTDSDIEKIEIIKCLVNNPESFFELNSDAIMGIFEFLDIKEELREELFTDLISPQSYLKRPQVREAIPKVRK